MAITDFIGTGITLVGSILTIGIYGGVLQSKVNSLSETLEDLDRQFKDAREKAPEKYVRMNHFESIIRPMQDQLSDIQSDIKSILMNVSNEGNHRTRKTPG